MKHFYLIRSLVILVFAVLIVLGISSCDNKTDVLSNEDTDQPAETTVVLDKIMVKPAETTAEPDETTAEPDETTAEPDETTAEPDETTAEPDETTVEPDETTVELDETTVEPDETTVEPDETTVEPDETTVEFDETTAEPDETTVEFDETTAEPETTACVHEYEAVVTPPTCTAGGYTTHICDCGNSFVDSYVAANGHNYVAGSCTVCQATKMAWDQSGDIVTVQNVDFVFADDYNDQMFMYTGSFDQWDKIANVTDATVQTLTYWGWVGIAADTAGSFGYSIDGGAPIYDASFTLLVDNEAVLAAARANNAATTHALNFGIVIDVADMIGTHTVETLYKDANGNVAVLCTFTVVKADPNAWTIVLSQYDGVGDAENGWKIHNSYGSQPFGQRFDIGDCALKQIVVNNLANFDQPVNSWTVKIWAWNTDYATTVAATALYEVSGENWLGSSDFIISIPDGTEITGEIYYEIQYTGAQAFTGWIGSSPAEGLVTYVNGGTVAPNHYAASIVVILADESETEAETSPAPTPSEQTLVLSEYIGFGTPAGANAHNLLGNVPMGQKFDIGEYALRRLTITKLATYGTNTNTWTIKFWQWNGNYARTTYSMPVYEISGSNHNDGQDFVINIPNDVVLTGEIYYELYYTSGTASFTGWNGGTAISGLVTYLNGALSANHYASSVYVVRLNDSEGDEEIETEPVGEPETEPDYDGPFVSENYPSSTLPDYNRYTTVARIQEVLSSRKTWVIATGSSARKYYANGVLTENGNNLGFTNANGSITLNSSKLSDLFDVEVTGSTPLAVAAELDMGVIVYDGKLVLFYEGDLPFHTYDDMYTLEAMYLYMTDASETEILNAFIDLPSRISNNASNTVFYTASDLNLGVQTSIYFAQMGQTNGLLVGPSLVAGEGKHADNFTTVRIFNNQQICITQFLAFDASVRGGVQVAAAQVGSETLIATAAFANHAGTNGDVRVFDTFGLLRMTINVRDIISGPYTIATGHFAEGVNNEVLLIASQT
ncbi:MAG: hypothetical protein IKM33_03180, partial [Clostridia bacterium]|nr:hypothetical protein [Clostridia bacterium]